MHVRKRIDCKGGFFHIDHWKMRHIINCIRIKLITIYIKNDKKNYYSKSLQKHKNDVKSTWKILKNVNKKESHM